MRGVMCFVVPAKAGIQNHYSGMWAPAFAATGA